MYANICVNALLFILAKRYRKRACKPAAVRVFQKVAKRVLLDSAYIKSYAYTLTLRRALRHARAPLSGMGV